MHPSKAVSNPEILVSTHKNKKELHTQIKRGAVNDTQPLLLQGLILASSRLILAATELNFGI